MSPLRLYLLLSLVFFFLVQSLSKITIASSNANWVKINTDTSDIVIANDSLAIALLKDSSLFEEDEDSLSTAKSRRKLIRNRRLKESSIEALTDKTVFLQNLYQSISYALFLLMPVFALLLKLLYVR